MGLSVYFNHRVLFKSDIIIKRKDKYNNMVSIARKNLFHDKRRLAIILIGLATAIVMILYGFGSITGTIDESAGLIDKIDTDIWVMGEGNTDILTPSVIAEDTIKSIKEIKGVERVHKLIYSVNKIEKGEK